jgi:hypothetical protein
MFGLNRRSLANNHLDGGASRSIEGHKRSVEAYG